MYRGERVFFRLRLGRDWFSGSLDSSRGAASPGRALMGLSLPDWTAAAWLRPPGEIWGRNDLRHFPVSFFPVCVLVEEDEGEDFLPGWCTG